MVQMHKGKGRGFNVFQYLQKKVKSGIPQIPICYIILTFKNGRASTKKSRLMYSIIKALFCGFNTTLGKKSIVSPLKKETDFGTKKLFTSAISTLKSK